MQTNLNWISILSANRGKIDEIKSVEFDHRFIRKMNPQYPLTIDLSLFYSQVASALQNGCSLAISFEKKKEKWKWISKKLTGIIRISKKQYLFSLLIHGNFTLWEKRKTFHRASHKSIFNRTFHGLLTDFYVTVFNAWPRNISVYKSTITKTTAKFQMFWTTVSLNGVHWTLCELFKFSLWETLKYSSAWVEIIVLIESLHAMAKCEFRWPFTKIDSIWILRCKGKFQFFLMKIFILFLAWSIQNTEKQSISVKHECSAAWTEIQLSIRSSYRLCLKCSVTTFSQSVQQCEWDWSLT